MFRSYRLQPVTVHDAVLVFAWNPETGEVTGAGAPLVLELANSAQQQGTTLGHPYPTVFDIKDPLHSLPEIAVLLGNRWQLAPDLQAAYPVEEGDDLLLEIDADGNERPSEFQPLH